MTFSEISELAAKCADNEFPTWDSRFSKEANLRCRRAITDALTSALAGSRVPPGEE
jgi:hypothetical protein